ncbi:MAG: class I SAM-dependent methyltransferase [Blautia sp.]|nr:class I SAM-dependent methyltransferase [Blautia sp.]
MQLSNRLLAVSELVTDGVRLADVGTDHGYIPIWLIEQGRIPKAIAMDINRGPLMRAQENIRAHGLEDKIETRLSDGVTALCPGETDSVVIAGMGGGLVIKILKEGEEVLKTVSELVLQPQSDIDRVRRFLWKEGYRITSEHMVLEEGKYYPMMHVVHGEMEELSDIEALYGPCLLRDRNECLKLYLDREQRNMEKLTEGLRMSGTQKAKDRLAEVESALEKVKQAKEKMA